MNIKLTEEQISVREAAREFARTICKPGVIQRDTTMQYPFDEVKQMAELGFMGMMVDPLFGGSGLDTVSCPRDGGNLKSR
jgi:alkylation response protein AidB-like acyl-CoA dehydrogenase